MKYPEISVIIPCYRESAVIEDSVHSVASYLTDHFERFEIIIVTDGSPDDTPTKVHALGRNTPTMPLKLISFKHNQGKGAAVKEGVLASRYDPILYIDADLTIPIEELDYFMSAIKISDIAIASRLVPGARFEEASPWYRTLLARGFYVLQMLLLGNFEYSDTQCGFKLFRRDVGCKLFAQSRIKRFAFDAELLFLAKKIEATVAVLPVRIRKDIRNSNVRMLGDSIDMLGSLLKIKWYDWTGAYQFPKD